MWSPTVTQMPMQRISHSQENMMKLATSFEEISPDRYASSKYYSPPEQTIQEVPVVQFRKKSLHATAGSTANRHSYHGGSQQSFNSDHRFSHVPFSNPHYSTPNGRNQLSAQRSLDDWERSRCARKRLSGNFSLLSVLPEDGNMNETGINGRPQVDTMQQGADIHESPRGSVASGHSAGRDEKQPLGQQPSGHMMQQNGIPIQGQVLVDPSTGQHYIVPQTAFYQPLQPMYYPPPQPTPMYYPYGQHVPPQGYVNVMQPGQAPPHPQGAYAVSMQQFGQAGQRPYSGSVPFRNGYPGSVSSTEDISRQDERRFDDHPPQSPTFSAHTTVGFAPSYASSQITSFAQQYRQQAQPYGNSPNLRSSPNSQPEDPESGFRRDVTRSSAEFAPRGSGEFARQGSGEFSRSTGEFNRNREESQRQQQMQQPERTPLYGGPPQWWGRGAGREEGDSLTDFESKRQIRVSPPLQTTASDSEATRHQQQQIHHQMSWQQQNPMAARGQSAASLTGAPPSRSPPSSAALAAARPVRMDIDFNAPSSADEQPKTKPAVAARAVRLDFDFSKTMPEEEELRERMKAAPRVPATAFTVNFDSPSEAVSLQDAARKSAQARRVLGRRSGASAAAASTTGGVATSSPSAPIPSPRMSRKQPESSKQPQHSPPTGGANKSYLLKKLLHGPTSGEHESGSDIPDMPEEKKDNDSISEAGTFIVDTSTRTATSNPMMSGRIVEDSDSDTASDSGSSRTASPTRPPVQPTPNSAEKKDDILQGLCKLRQMAGIRPTTSPAAASTAFVPIRPSRISETARPTPLAAQPLPVLAKRTSLGSSHSANALITTPTPANRSVVHGRQAPNQQVTSTPGNTNTPSSANNNPFRRGDGGRFSMRGGMASPQAGGGPKRPPFRAGGAPARPQANPSVQREQEMNAWLRRKDYNPMKAAAEAKKAKEMKSRGDHFASNRSISFHVGPAAARQQQSQQFAIAELQRNRSHESLAVDEAEQASQRIVAEYSRGVVKDLNRLQQQSSHATSGKQLSGLARAVDMLSQKCKKSIELIRNQNKGCLSVSVEDLLAAAADPPREDESLNDQLDRLSDAFDAVQRYLEQYSLDGHQSPIPEFCEEPETSSVVSGFSGFSLRSHQLSQERAARINAAGSTTAPAIGGSLVNGPSSPRPSAFRSRLHISPRSSNNN